MTKTSSHYIHGTSPEEQQRLGLMNQLLNEASLRELRLEGSEKVLDVGSGLGELSRMMGRQLGKGRVVGVERSVEQIEAARGLAAAAGETDLVTMREGDALALPLHPDEWGTFDVVHARFLLEHLPDPVAAVRAMVRAARPGGRIVLEDDDHEILRLWPEVPRFSALWHAYMRTYERHGNDPLTGRKLVQFLQQASAQPRRCQWIFFGACSGQDTFPIVIDNCVGILEGARAEILEEGVVSDAGFAGAIDDLRNWSARGDAAFWFAMAWAEGIRGPDI